jgi:hypothetical protein
LTRSTGAYLTTYSLVLSGGYTTTQSVYMSKGPSSPITPSYASIYIKAAQTNSNGGIFRTVSDTGYFGLYCEFMSDGKMYTFNSSGASVLVGSYSADEWYRLEFKNINWSAHTYDLWVNGAMSLTGTTFRSISSNNCSSILLCNYDNTGAGTYTFYFDEIMMK